MAKHSWLTRNILGSSAASVSVDFAGLDSTLGRRFGMVFRIWLFETKKLSLLIIHNSIVHNHSMKPVLRKLLFYIYLVKKSGLVQIYGMAKHFLCVCATIIARFNAPRH